MNGEQQLKLIQAKRALRANERNLYELRGRIHQAQQAAERAETRAQTAEESGDQALADVRWDIAADHWNDVSGLNGNLNDVCSERRRLLENYTEIVKGSAAR